MTSKSFGSEKGHIPHLAQDGKSGVIGEVGDLRHDVEQAITKLESRPTSAEFPEIDWVDGKVNIEGGTVVIKGRKLLQGQKFASASFGLTTAKLDFYAVTPGEAGNAYSAKIVQGSGALAVAFAANLVTVTLKSTGSTANEVATEVNKAAPNDLKGLIRCVSGGAGTVLIASEKQFTGGEGTGWECLVGGVAALPLHATGTTPAANVEETVCSVTCPALSGTAALDTAAISVKSNNVLALPVSVTLATSA
jgi:hypothetical protein